MSSHRLDPNAFTGHLDALKALKEIADRYGWGQWTVEVYPQHGVIEAFAVSPSGTYELGGLFTSEGEPRSYFLLYEPDGNFSSAQMWRSPRMETVARRKRLADIEELVTAYS